MNNRLRILAGIVGYSGLVQRAADSLQWFARGLSSVSWRAVRVSRLLTLSSPICHFPGAPVYACVYGLFSFFFRRHRYFAVSVSPPCAVESPASPPCALLDRCSEVSCLKGCVRSAFSGLFMVSFLWASRARRVFICNRRGGKTTSGFVVSRDFPAAQLCSGWYFLGGAVFQARWTWHARASATSWWRLRTSTCS